ncbi:MAG: YitT family protein [Ruminiclostridium sp.]|nr:YitT family protein [Ruminiclostridium sp.]
MDKKKIGRKILSDAGRLSLCTAAGAIFALNLNTFVHTGGLLPGGFSGLTILLQNIFSEFFGISVPYSPVYICMNLIPAAIAFKKIGKRFTIFSFITIIVMSLLTDILPHYEVTSDMLLISVFGGIINGFATSLCLIAGATSGGTDFISIAISEKYHIDAFNYILAFNAVLLSIDGFMFGWEKALYSIIFQYTTTLIINFLYKRYKKNTMFIVTEKPREVAETINSLTRHGATRIDAHGTYRDSSRQMLYSVVGTGELKKLIREIKKIDPDAFINVIKTDRLIGNFYIAPND